MARKMKMPKASQIKGIKKALRNKKTPRAFIPSLKKRLKALGGTLVISLLSWVCTPTPALAQYTSVSPQTVNQLVISAATGPQVTPNSSAIGCVPTALAPCGVRNVGQSIHSIVYLISGTCTNPTLDVRINASNDGVNFFALSQDAVDIPVNPVTGTAKSGGVTAVGSFPVYQVDLASFSCTGGGTISVWYSGTSTTTPPDSAIFQQANLGRQALWQNVATNTALGSLQVSTPFENASGSVWIMCSTTCPAGMSIVISALPLVNVASPSTFTLATIPVGVVSGWQKFDVIDSPSNILQVAVTGAGDGSITWTAIYNFVPSVSQVNGAVNLNCLNGCFGSQTNIGDPCQASSFAKSSVSISTTTKTRIVAGVANKSVYGCGYALTLSGGVASLSVQFVAGTQTTTPCDTAATNLSGAMIPNTSTTAAAGTNVPDGGGSYTHFQTPLGQDLCVFPNADANNIAGYFVYAIQ